MKLILPIIIFLFSPFFAIGENYISDDLESQLFFYITDIYKIYETNPVHKEINEKIYRNFLDILSNYESFTQEELDLKATEIFQTFYSEIHFDALEDSDDLRRQSMRAAISYSTLALCSNYDSCYYLGLARNSLCDSKGPQEFFPEIYTSQFLVNVYILNLKQSISGIRRTLKDFFEFYDLLDNPSRKMQEMNSLLREIEALLPPNNK